MGRARKEKRKYYEDSDLRNDRVNYREERGKEG